jgi:hypothetical protein
MIKITQTKRFTKNFSSLLESILKEFPQFTLKLLDNFDQVIASISRFPEIGVPRIRNWYGKHVTLRDVEVFVSQRQLTVRYHYKKSLNQIVLVHIWIDGQNHN